MVPFLRPGSATQRSPRGGLVDLHHCLSLQRQNPPISPPSPGRSCPCRALRTARNAIMIHHLDFDQIRSQAARNIIGAKYMLDQESFSVFSGPYPFSNPPSHPEPADDPAPGQHAADEGPTDGDTDLLGLNSDKGEAQEPRKPAYREPARRPFFSLGLCPPQTGCPPAHAYASPSRPTGAIAVAPLCPVSASQTLSDLPRRTPASSTWTTTNAYAAPGLAAHNPFAPLA